MKIKKEQLVFHPGSLVWARMRFCPYWPARIVETPPNMGNTPNGKTCVLFFGTKEFAFIDKDKIEDYATHREKFVVKSRGIGFQVAVKQMDEFKTNPTKFHSHGFVKPTMNKIPIKTERDVECRLELKVEPQSPLQPVQAEHKSSVIDWTQQKQTLVNRMIALKAENQRNLLALKKTQSDCDLLSVSKQKLEQIIAENKASYSVQLKEIKLELSNAKSEIVELKSSAEKTISELKRDKQILMARVKQFESGMQQKSAFERCNKRSDSEDGEYEVEAILDHRDLKNERQYLIRWKGYGSSEDSWEKEKNLACPKILNKYKRSTGLNIK